MSPQGYLQLARVCGKAVEVLEELQSVLMAEARDRGLTSDAATLAKRVDLRGPTVADITGGMDPASYGCGCSLTARCDHHEATRPKGCHCNGPYASADCAMPAHRAVAAKWPAGDPSRVE